MFDSFTLYVYIFLPFTFHFLCNLNCWYDYIMYITNFLDVDVNRDVILCDRKVTLAW